MSRSTFREIVRPRAILLSVRRLMCWLRVMEGRRTVTLCTVIFCGVLLAR